MKRTKLGGEEIAERLKTLDGWRAADEKLTKNYKFDDFARSLELVNKIGAIAERRDHHPDIRFGWGYAEISVTTHDAGGVTARDFELAKEIDDLTDK
jgi:4a-hydroxytetrahydrobiopterin dehydratase